MPKSPRLVFVDVFIKKISPLDFDVLPSQKNDPQLGMKQTAKPGQPDIVFHNNKHKGFEIHFELQGDTHGYFFPPNAQEAVWSQRGTACPNVSGVWDVFEPIEVVASGEPPERRTLKVKNLNPHMGGGKGQGKFMYNLRVTNGIRPLDLDPGGENQNGGYGLTSAYETVAIGTVAFAAFTAYGFGLFGNPGFVRSTGYVLVAVGTLCFAAFASYVSGLFDR